ncbi:hypothetical protein TTHERM_00390050 (macronuclear) [Tetrahymena thermophila SB210]|uniref:Uncharacterized protein n=1 Tax=Tetrahymena thermophila (strain SB210) TaxID=312017 RepID=Q23R83_TETTS|nr:hypothetical protein TTHERM_00390050 [Tetrahymena thermophila SB210]EAR99165.3 hypothetical protein TTHERM_00390050 [Tetrahymena thermophila SB210]|eukprot:XP_001019410.3 hypothetical protein TTHERM_00390050 [Tetrahymena thermophila SB210]
MEFQGFSYKCETNLHENQNNISCTGQSYCEENYISTNNYASSFYRQDNEYIQPKQKIDVQPQCQNIQNEDGQLQFYESYRINQGLPIQKGSQTNFCQQLDSQTHLLCINEQNQLSQSQICGSLTFANESENFYQQQQQEQQMLQFVPQNQHLWIENSQIDEESCEHESNFENFKQTSTDQNEQNKNSQQIVVCKKNKFSFTDVLYETQQLNYRENYYLIGDLFINVNMYLDGAKKNRRDRSSIWNQIRPVTCIQVNQAGYFSIVVDDTQGALEDFDRVISVLDKQQHGHAHQQAQWLISYKQYLNNLDKARKKIYDEYSYNTQLIQQKLAENTIKSLQMAEDILQKYYAGENDYVIYSYRRTNHNNLTQTLYKGGMSKAMQKLIYITEDNFRNDTLRYGMLELFNFEGYESVNYSYIFGQSGKIQGKKEYKNFTLFTVDDLEIELDMEEMAYELSKISLSAGGTWFSDQLRVYKFTVTPYKLFQLSIMRKDLSNLYGEEFYKNTEYYQNSKSFISKYYDQNNQNSKKILRNKIILKNQNS